MCCRWSGLRGRTCGCWRTRRGRRAARPGEAGAGGLERLLTLLMGVEKFGRGNNFVLPVDRDRQQRPHGTDDDAAISLTSS